MYRGRSFSFIVLILAGFGLLGLSSSRAQVTGADPLTVELSPAYPAPYQTVTVTPSSTLFDIAAASVSVTVNGTAFYKGSGGTAVQVPIGGPGTSTTIVVSVTSADGQVNKKSFVIRPASVALVVEPLSSTHPFYAGPGLVSPEGRVRLIAVADLRPSATKALDPATLEYTWKLGDQILTNDSGIGKSVLNASAPQRYRDAPVSVTVSSPDGNLNAQAQTTISPVDPIVRIYRNDPLLGPLFDNSLSDTVTLSGSEDTYRGVGYYFSTVPKLSWAVNGVDSGATEDITLHSAGSGTGTAVLNFSANQTGTTQSANTSISVNFGQKQRGLFGL